MVDEEKIRRILCSVEHDSLEEAILADFIDILPLIGDITNAMRIKEAIDKKMPEYVAALQAGDFLGGFIPVIGDLFDLLSPTNTIVYLLREGKIKW